MGDGSMCSNGVCDQADCCQVQCWASGWRNHGDASGSYECPAGKNARPQSDGHMFSGAAAAAASECCGETCAAIDSASCPTGQQHRGSEKFCHGGACSTGQCCFVGCGAWSAAGNTCSGDRALKTDESCDGDAISGCSESKCCRHPLEIKCQSQQAQDCSKCAKYAPCVSSIDPRCIRQKALDCLACKTHIDCAACVPDWDNNCLSHETYGDPACSSAIKYQFPTKMNECYLLPPFAGEGHRIQSSDGTQRSKCTDASCSSCGESGTFSFANYSRDVAAGTCTPDGDEGKMYRGLLDATKPGSPCPSAAPCGLASCVPGVDKKCIVFTVFKSSSTCSVAEMAKYATVGDYHAFATGDDTCRKDGNGRSYYKLTINPTTESGTGVIGCTDAACSVGCTDVAMTRGVCSTPSWANGLQLVANAVVSDFSSSSPANVASSPPPPPSPPYAPPPASYAVKMAVTISGDVSAFTPEVLTPIRQKVANEASVPLDAVEATATAGSVKIDFTVNMQSEAAATTALTAITAKLADKAAASTFLSTPALTVAVEAIVAPTVLVLVSPPPPPAAPPPASPPKKDDDSGSGALIGGIVGGLVGACLLVGVGSNPTKP